MSQRLVRRFLCILFCGLLFGSVAGCLDQDGDGIVNDMDNCPTLANPDQADANGNGVGDACDEEDPANGECTDGRDNDGDGLTDEDDPDCQA